MHLRYHFCLSIQSTALHCDTRFLHQLSTMIYMCWHSYGRKGGQKEKKHKTPSNLVSHPTQELSWTCQLMRCAAGIEYCQCSDLLALCFFHPSNRAENLHKCSLLYLIWKITTVTQCFGAFYFYSHQNN